MAFAHANNDIRIKRALKSRLSATNDEFYQLGDKVFFKEENKLDWSGPAKVRGSEGKVVYIKYGNKYRRVHNSKVMFSM